MMIKLKYDAMHCNNIDCFDCGTFVQSRAKRQTYW